MSRNPPVDSEKPGPWETVTLSDVADIIDPHPSHRAPPEVKEGIPFPGIGDFDRDGTIHENKCRIVAATVYEQHQKRYVIEEGNIGFGRVATIGKVVRLKNNIGPYAVSPTLAVIKPKSIDSAYLRYALQGQEIAGQIGELLTGTTRSSLGIELLRKLNVTLPPAVEAETIGTILDLVEQSIESCTAGVSKQRRIVAGLMQDLLTNGIDKRGQARSEVTHEFKDSPVGRIPGEWDVELLERLTKERITYGIVQAGPHVEGGIPYIRTGDMGGDELRLDGLLRTSPTIAASYKRSSVHTNDIVFALRATVGKVLLVPPELDGANLTQGTAKISPRSNFSHRFLLWIMRDRKTRMQIDIAKKGTTFEEITLKNLRALIIPYPKEFAEQLRIANLLDLQEECVRAEKRRLAKLQSLKAGLMHDLLTGKVRVPREHKEQVQALRDTA